MEIAKIRERKNPKYGHIQKGHREYMDKNIQI